MKRVKRPAPSVKQPKKAQKQFQHVSHATIIDPVGAGFIGEGYVSLGDGNYRRSIHTSGT